jgi:hypothetical protein
MYRADTVRRDRRFIESQNPRINLRIRRDFRSQTFKNAGNLSAVKGRRFHTWHAACSSHLTNRRNHEKNRSHHQTIQA